MISPCALRLGLPQANFVTCSLSENYRQLGDENGRFRELLEKLRLGVDMNKTQREIQELCSIDSADGKGPVVLCSKNSEVESVNSGAPALSTTERFILALRNRPLRVSCFPRMRRSFSSTSAQPCTVRCSARQNEL